MSLRKILVATACMLPLSAGADENRFSGKDAVSPRLIVDEFSPWVSDNYPNLVRSVDLDAAAKNGNRLFCEKQEVKEDGTIECRAEGEISSYKYLGQLKDGTHVFLTSSSGETGTYVAIAYRFVSIAPMEVFTADGEKATHAVMTLRRDVPLPHKAGFQHRFTADKSAFEIESEGFHDGKKTTTTVQFDPTPAEGEFLCEALCTYTRRNAGIARISVISRGKQVDRAWQDLESQCAEVQAAAAADKRSSLRDPLTAPDTEVINGSKEYKLRPATLDRDCVSVQVSRPYTPTAARAATATGSSAAIA